MFFGVVRRNLHNCPRSVRETTYKSLVRPTLEYGSAAWDLYYEKDIQKLERIQRKTARFCAGNYSYYASVTEMLQELKAGVDVNLSEFLQSLRKWLKGKQVLSGLTLSEGRQKLTSRRYIRFGQKLQDQVSQSTSH